MNCRFAGGEHPSRDNILAAYDETMDLLNASRTYLDAWRKKRFSGAKSTDRIFMVSQEMLITARLASAMAWLMTRRALDIGEIPADDCLVDAVDPFDDAHACLGEDGYDDDRLTDRHRELLSRSHTLYCRVIAMDVALRGQHMTMRRPH